MKWEKMPISSVYEGLYDGPHATPPSSDSGAVFLGISNITQNGHLDFSQIKYISKNDLPKWTKRVTPREGDIVFSYEATLNLYAMIPADFWGCLGRRMALIRPDESKAYGKFLYYYFFSDEWRATVAKHIVTGATVDRIPLIKFPSFEVSIPPLPTQSKIVSILSAYDNLIENNQRQIKLLEEAAQRLYQEWFVKLRFPGHEKVKIVDGVPEGWKRCLISDVCDTIGGGTPSTKNPEYYNNGTVRWVTPTDITKNNSLILLDTEKRITEEGLANSSAKLVPPYTILMTSRASVGFFGLCEYSVCTNQGFISCVPHDERFRLYLLGNLLYRVDEIRQKATGSTFLEISKKTFRNMEVVVPDSKILGQYNAMILPIMKMMERLAKSTRQLVEARDRLLPKLMSGEIEV